MEGVNPLLVRCASEALKTSKHDMSIPWMGGLRTPQQQHRIYKTGNSQLDGYERKSYHQTGNALDVIPVSGGYANDKAFRHFAKCMFTAWQKILHDCPDEVDYILEWGGHWQNFIDTPHWQIKKI
mgnify:CR=1 FL=1